MKTTLLRAGALACALMTSTALTAPAMAQDNQAPQPAFRGLDDNGVDLVSGSYPISMVEGRIGSGDAALSVVRTGTGTYGTTTWQNIYAYQTVSGAVRTVVITLGDRSEQFTSTSGGAFVAAQGNGATLTGGEHADFTYTGGGGSTITFGAPVEDRLGASSFCSHSGANLNGCQALATGMARPDGATTSLDWDIATLCATTFNLDGSLDCQYAWRLAGVTNNFGYALAFNYISDSVPLHQLPSGDWFKRSGITLSHGADSRTISYAYPSGGVMEVTDMGGRVWRLTAGANSLGIRRPGSSADDISVTFSGNFVTQIVRDGVTTTYSRVVSGTDATTTITAVDGDAGTTDPQTVVVADLSLGRITSVTDPLGRVTTYQYDGSSRLTRVTRPEGNSIGYAYDGRGNVTETRLREKDDNGDTGDDIVSTASYDSSCANVLTCNQPNSITDARGNVTNYPYSSTHGGVLTVTAPAPSSGADRPETRYSYSTVSGAYRVTAVSACQSGTAASCLGTANEGRIVIGYDNSGNTTSVERRNGTGTLTATSAMTYDGYGNLLTVDGPLSGTADTTRYRYNASREVIGAVGPDPDGAGALKHRAIRTTYDGGGRVTRVEAGNVDSQSDADWAAFSALQRVEQDYDANARPVVQRLMAGTTTYSLTQTNYDVLGRVRCVAQRMNPNEFATSSLPSDACALDTEGSFGPARIARASYNAVGEVTKVETGVGVTGVAADEVTSTYSNNGRAATVTDANGNRTSYVYDGFDRLSQTQFPSPTTPGSSNSSDYEQLSYDANGNVTARRLRDGQSIGFAYDALNRLTWRDIPSPTTGESDILYFYDNYGRPTLWRIRSPPTITSCGPMTRSAGSRWRPPIAASAAWSPTRRAG
jgi:YD repeat-containing protein